MKREDVKALQKQLVKFDFIAAAGAGIGGNVPVPRDHLRALCERWLAVEDATPVEIDSSGDQVVLVAVLGDELDLALISARLDALHGQRVRIVPDPVAGNGGGDG